jgi:hypothetical protein
LKYYRCRGKIKVWAASGLAAAAAKLPLCGRECESCRAAFIVEQLLLQSISVPPLLRSAAKLI